jgi:1,6-anhydro-N-acetylmuramate kinase
VTVRNSLARAETETALAAVRRDLASCSLDEMLQLLQNRRVPAAALERIGRETRWIRHHAVRRRLVLHPNMPLALALRLAPALGWRDLVELASDQRLRASLRRSAERDLAGRVEQLTLGEQIALARDAPPLVARRLLTSEDPRVLVSLLDNRRLVEQDAVRIACASETPPEVLTRLAGHSRWRGRRAVGLALATNRRTSIATALRVVATLDRRDLQCLGRDATVSPIVRIGADRRLAALRRPGARPGSG